MGWNNNFRLCINKKQISAFSSYVSNGTDFFLQILLYYNMLEIKMIHLCSNDA